MKQIILDSNIITDQSRSGSYNVRYALYYDGRRRRKNSIYIPENLKSEFGVDFVSNRTCFAGFRGELGSYYSPDPYTKRNNKNVPIPNRVYYVPDMKSTGSPKPTLTEMYTWIRLCKQHKLLPEYVAPSVVSKGRVVFDITETSPSKKIFRVVMFQLSKTYELSRNYIKCECGVIIKKGHFKRHLKAKLHKNPLTDKEKKMKLRHDDFFCDEFERQQFLKKYYKLFI